MWGGAQFSFKHSLLQVVLWGDNHALNISEGGTLGLSGKLLLIFVSKDLT